MGTSQLHGKVLFGLTAHKISCKAEVGSILDIGAGNGTYARIFREVLTRVPKWIAVEVWGPYVVGYGLKALYDRVCVADVACLDMDLVPPGSMAFMGDVLEHIDAAEVPSLMQKLFRKCDYILLAIPIGECPQEALHGNEWERHLASWDVETVKKLPGFAGAVVLDVPSVGITAVVVCGATPEAGAVARSALADSYTELEGRSELIEEGPPYPQWTHESVARIFHKWMKRHIDLSSVKDAS